MPLPEALQRLTDEDEETGIQLSSMNSEDSEVAGGGAQIVPSGPSRSALSRSRLGLLRPAVLTSPRQSGAPQGVRGGGAGLSREASNQSLKPSHVSL